MLLHDLLRRHQPNVPLGDLPNVLITGVREDSRLVRPGELFIARGGTKTDGLKFLNDARARGAAAAVGESPLADAPLPYAVVPDAAAAASHLAHAFQGNPSKTVKTLGVTGTNGKTTTTYLLRHLLSTVNVRCGMIGTVEIDDGATRREASMTTPAACDIAELLATMHDNGCGACAIEVSSHALDQRRVAAVEFAAAAFTNLTGDHLDYHGGMDAYAAAKAKLFESLAPGAPAIVNGRDEWSRRMVERTRGRVVRFGFTDADEYQATGVSVTAQGSRFTLRTPRGQAEVAVSLIGLHNVENILTAAAMAGETFGLTARQLADGLRDAAGAPGRLQVVRCGQPFAVLVDYAHTDDALANVLTALRPLCNGKLRVLFGCGGDRDRTKRPRMAHVAEQLADVIYVTSDNPRTERPQAILDEIQQGFSLATAGRMSVEVDRRKAIQNILSDAGADDVVLLAGKGHENYQIIGTEKTHFDDVEEATRALKGRSAAA
jgi:UDP-N-acetylmuramoyl-L-alanyl-D-glutamate--2,6-diaminopimelate ligase